MSLEKLNELGDLPPELTPRTIGSLEISTGELDQLIKILDHYIALFEIGGAHASEVLAIHEKAILLRNDLHRDMIRKLELLNQV